MSAALGAALKKLAVALLSDPKAMKKVLAIVLTLLVAIIMAISHQALVQKSASRIKTQSSNEKYTFRVWLLRLGLIGDEFKTARHHLLKNLDGNIAWKDPAQAEAQKQRLAEKRLAESVAQAMGQAPAPPDSAEEMEQEESEGPRMSM